MHYFYSTSAWGAVERFLLTHAHIRKIEQESTIESIIQLAFVGDKECEAQAHCEYTGVVYTLFKPFAEDRDQVFIDPDAESVYMMTQGVAQQLLTFLKHLKNLDQQSEEAFLVAAELAAAHR